MKPLFPFILALGVLAAAATAQEPEAHRWPASLEARVPRLELRLAALAPARPRDYFELGEEVASESSEDLDRRLARQLYVLAFELSRVSPRPDAQLGPGACLALAAIAETDDERRWLMALAETLGPEGGVGGGAMDARRIKSSSASRDPAAFDLSTMLSFVRTGEGRRAAKILEKPGVSELLDKCDTLLMPGVGGAALVRQHIDEWPACPQCRGRRFVKDASGVHLCPTCHGVPGPVLPVIELVGEIRTESVLLSGQQRSWAGQITADGGSPLRELDISELAATYNVDPARPLWRNGHWESDPNAPKPKGGAGSPSGADSPTPADGATGASPGATKPVKRSK